MNDELRFEHYPFEGEDPPASWKLTALDSILANIRSGFASGQHNKDGEGIPHLRPMNISPSGNIDLSEVRYVQGGNPLRLQRGDVLFNNTNSLAWVGKTTLIETDNEFAFSNHMTRLRISSAVDPMFVAKQLHFLCSQGYFRHHCKKHVNQASIATDFLSRCVPVRLPPASEQRRIMAKIEALQERSRRAREALSEVGPLLDQFRQSVLAAAFRGNLTADWRAAHPNIEPASELLHRIRAERRRRWEEAELAKYEAKNQKPPKNRQDKYEEPELVDNSLLTKLPNRWEWVRVKDIGQVQLGRQRSPKYHSGPNMRPYLRVMNVFEDRIVSEDIMEMVFSPEDFERYRLAPGDILLNEGQSHELVGRSAIYRGEIPSACFTNTLVRFRPDAPIESEYPQLVFLSYLKTGRFQQLASLTVNIAHLGAGRFADMEFPLPPLDEQAEIVRRARGALDQITQLEERLCTNFADLDQLDQAILAKAFRGELVPQDPNDEPASALLERIREQRAQQAGSTKRSKKTSQTQQGTKTEKKASRLTPEQLTLSKVL